MSVIKSRANSVTIPISDGWSPAARQERHEHAVAQTLRWARDAADGEDFSEALQWLLVVEVIDGTLAPGWQRTQERWRRLSAERGSRRWPRPPA
jgi:hypothetical protein